MRSVEFFPNRKKGSCAVSTGPASDISERIQNAVNFRRCAFVECSQDFSAGLPVFGRDSCAFDEFFFGDNFGFLQKGDGFLLRLNAAHTQLPNFLATGCLANFSCPHCYKIEAAVELHQPGSAGLQQDWLEPQHWFEDWVKSRILDHRSVRQRPAFADFVLEIRCRLATMGLCAQQDEGVEKLAAWCFAFQIQIVKVAQAGVVVRSFQVELAKAIQRLDSMLSFHPGVEIHMPTCRSRERHHFSVLDSALCECCEPSRCIAVFPGFKKRSEERRVGK